jgi:hypothetical protein
MTCTTAVLNGAVCLFASETSRERSSHYFDRRQLVETSVGGSAAFLPR